jgi:fibronectin-binding autotransporter adhesin
VVIVRYAGSQIATGGTVTTIGGDTIHTFTGNGTFGIQAGSFRSTLSGVIGGSGDFTFNGPGTLSLAAANSYSGDTIIAAGTLQVGDGGSTGTLGGTGSVANDGMLAFNRSDAILFYREITGAGGLVQAGSGTLTVSATNSHTGGTTISAGTLALGSAGALGTAGPISLTGGTLQFSAVNTTDYSSRFSTAAGQGYRLDTNGEDVTLAGDLTSSGGSLEKVGSGTLTLTGANTYSGGTTISAGTLVGTTVSLQGNIANAAALVFDQAADGGFAGVISGTGSLTKNNAGNLVLSGSNSYTGPTSITAGRLSVNGALGNTAVTVATAAELGGTGSIGGTVAVQAGGRVLPGNSIGVLTQGETTFDNGAIFTYEVDSSELDALGSAADLLVVNGGLNIASGTLLEFSDLAGVSAQAFVEDSTVLAMINYTGAWDGGLFTYGGQELGNLSRFFVGDQQWEINYAATSGGLNFTDDYQANSSFVTITAVPEPATLALLAIAGLGLAAARYAGRFRIRCCSASGTTVRESRAPL